MPRVRMLVTKGIYAGGTEWIVSGEEAVALMNAGEAVLVPEPAPPPAGELPNAEAGHEPAETEY